MALPVAVDKVKLFIGILYSHDETLRRSHELLEQHYGRIDYRSESFRFDVTHYYEQEMGSNLYRMFICFQSLILPDRIARIKLETNAIEDALAINGQRTVNLDCGYMDYFKVVLASTKFAGPKIYLSDGIYADMTLRYEKGQFYPYDWTFADFKLGRYDRFFRIAREKYKIELRKLRKAGATP